MEPDQIDKRLAIWAVELPELDLETEGIVDRLTLIAKQLRRSLDETASSYGLTLADWGLLSVLRGSGAPYVLTAGELASRGWLTPGAMTARLDRLEERGLVRRVPDDDDRRVLRIELTEEGRTTWDDAVGVQAEKERLLSGALTAAERKQLDGLLRKLLRGLTALGPT